jgi:DNA-binding transcriptional LysR family regulator
MPLCHSSPDEFLFCIFAKATRLDWNDLKLFLAVARLGSIRGAAEELGLNQSTVNRRLEVLEHALKLQLFDATTRGHVLTAQGQALVDVAAPMQGQADAVVQAATLFARQSGGVVKLTAAPAIFGSLLGPVLAAFNQQHPDVSLSYDESERTLDLFAGDADIALRAGWTAPDDTFVSVWLQDHPWTAYCSPAYASKRGMPAQISDLSGHDVVRLGGKVGEGKGNQWFMAQTANARSAGLAEGVVSMRHILTAGLGVGILPTVIGDDQPGLVRCFGPVPELMASMWLVTTPQMSRDPRIKAFAALAKKMLRP